MNIKDVIVIEGTAIILVTHDSMIASYAKKFMYLRDGTIHMVISRNDASQEEFFQAIVEVTTQDSLRKRFMQGGDGKDAGYFIDDYLYHCIGILF